MPFESIYDKKPLKTLFPRHRPFNPDKIAAVIYKKYGERGINRLLKSCEDVKKRGPQDEKPTPKRNPARGPDLQQATVQALGA